MDSACANHCLSCTLSGLLFCRLQTHAGAVLVTLFCRLQAHASAVEALMLPREECQHTFTESQSKLQLFSACG